jgi:hypothetical protein
MPGDTLFTDEIKPKEVDMANRQQRSNRRRLADRRRVHAAIGDLAALPSPRINARPLLLNEPPSTSYAMFSRAVR